MVPRSVLALLLVLLVSACAMHKAPENDSQQPLVGTADLEDVPPPPRNPPSESYTPTRRPFEVPPRPLSKRLPLYPDSALPSEVTCVGRILYHVEVDGSATLVRLNWDVAPPDRFMAAFELAIRAAIDDWEFRPAVQVTPEKHPDGTVTPQNKFVPKARYAVIRFRVEQGQGVVE